MLQRESGLSPTTSGLVLMVGALGWAAGSAYSGRSGAPDTFGTLLRAATLALFAGAAISLALVPVDHLTWVAAAVATVGFATMAVGMGLATPLLSTLVLEYSPAGRLGESGSAIQLSDALGQSVAAGLVGAAFARWYLLDQQTSYLSGFGLAVLLAALALVVMPRAVPHPVPRPVPLPAAVA